MSTKAKARKDRTKKAAGGLAGNDELRAQEQTQQTKKIKPRTEPKLTWPVQEVATKTNTGPDQYGQQGSTASANRDRIKASGQDSRARGYLSGRCKRSQASRDAKS